MLVSAGRTFMVRGAAWLRTFAASRALSDEVWTQRHRSVVVVAFAHLPLLWIVGTASELPASHLAVELLPVAALAVLAASGRVPRRWRTLAATGSLLVSSGILVHLTGGLIESHFHFFVVVSVVLLYHDWIVFAAAFVFVVAHHGVMGVVSPRSVYNHPAAWDRPLLWAGIHALYIAANCVAGVVNWRANERERDRSQAYAAALAEQTVELERAGNAKSEFLSRMSHELRTPLNAILGFGQILEMDDRIDDDGKKAVETILGSGWHLLGLIDEVLDISRIEAGRMPLCLDTVDVDEMLVGSFDLVRPLARERDVALRTAAQASGAFVVADEQRLRQVILNLLSNAVKYNREGGEVLVATHTRGDMVSIEVTDTGPGLSSVALERLFVPFERVGADDSVVKGTGLGLTISKRLVEAMDGELSVSSEPGRGSTFCITMPSAPAPVEADVVAPAKQPAATPPGAALDVFYIEDDPSNVELVRQVLRQRPGVRLTTASDASVGLAMIGEQRPDLVLMDLQLPGMDGERAIAELKADPVLEGVPVAVLSADASPARIERLRSAGACAYLTKPIVVLELLSLVDGIAKRGTAAGLTR